MIRFTVGPSWRELPRVNALLNGTVRSRYVVDDYRTTLSIKAVVSGESWYATPAGRYRVTPDVFLILNEGQRYWMDAGTGTETLCPFFAPGFIGEAQRALTTTNEVLLDEPVGGGVASTEFVEQLHAMNSRIGAILKSMHRAVKGRVATEQFLEEAFYGLASELASIRTDDARKIAAFPALRHTTREELYRRLCRARDFLASSFSEPLSVADAASIAALSPFHFHRSFKAAFGMPPMEFLRRRRLEVAYERLRRGNAVTEVAGAVGFDSLSSFSTLFRRRFGVSPNDLRKKQD